MRTKTEIEGIVTKVWGPSVSRGEKILLLAYARSCQHMGESETAINAAPRAVSELRKYNFIPRELSSFLKESVKTAHFNLIAASL